MVSNTAVPSYLARFGTPRRTAVGLLILLLWSALILPAYASTTVQLNQSLPIEGSKFQDSENDCGPNPTAPYAWHFILNKLDPGTDPGTLSVTFKNSGSKSATGSPTGKGHTQHFYVYLSSADTLQAASAVVEDQQDPSRPHLVLSHIAEGCTSSSSTPPTPTPVTVAVSPGSCIFSNGSSVTPVTASISPSGGATVAVRNALNNVVHTFPTSGSTFNASPGSYTWQATAQPGFQLSGPTSGSFVAASCAPGGPTPVTVNVSAGACSFNGMSLTPVTASISPAGGATIAVKNALNNVVHTFPTSGSTFNASPGSYTWQATALTGFALSGVTSGGFTALSCGDDPVPTRVSGSAILGDCSFSTGSSITPITASISPAGGATVALTKTGTGLVHTFPTDGSRYNASSGDYTWMTVASAGHEVSGAASGAFNAKSCAPTTSVLGVNVVRTRAAAVSGQQLPATGWGSQLSGGLALAAMLIAVGLVMNRVGSAAMGLGAQLSGAPTETLRTHLVGAFRRTSLPKDRIR